MIELEVDETLPISKPPTIHKLKDRDANRVFDYMVNIEEKIDGSQFSFGLVDGKLLCRSRSYMLDSVNPNGMFGAGITYLQGITHLLKEGWIYRGEYLGKTKHNVLNYGRMPQNHICIYDIVREDDTYLSYKDKQSEASELGLETTPLLFEGFSNEAHAMQLLDTDSYLGNHKIEGVVVKAYSNPRPDKSVLFVKFVSPAFVEAHTGKFPNSKQAPDFGVSLVQMFKTEARWRKAVQHLTEEGVLKGQPSDIGPIVREVQADILREHKDEIVDLLLAHYTPKLNKGVVAGLPEWYKALLAEELA